MKHIHILFLIALIFGTSCSNTEKGNADTAFQSDSEAIIEALENVDENKSGYSLSPEGIGPIKVGMPVASLPNSVAGLYDKYIVTPTPDANALTYLLNDDPQFTVYEFMQGNVDVVILEGPALSVKTPEGELRIGDSFVDFISRKDVTPEWVPLMEGDTDGMWYWRYNGLFIGIDEASASENELYDVVLNSKRSPRASDFSKNTKVGYIGTGLPF